MFSLVITIGSIMLIAILAYVTLYYGNSTVNTATRSTLASTLVSQAQTLLGASEAHHAKVGSWASSLSDLVASGHLKSVPDSPIESNGWTMPTPGAAFFALSGPIDQETCRAVNKAVRKDDGILSQAYTTLPIQCYGASLTELRVVATKSPLVLQQALPVGQVATGALPDTQTVVPSEWLVPPGAGATTPPSTPVGTGAADLSVTESGISVKNGLSLTAPLNSLLMKELVVTNIGTAQTPVSIGPYTTSNNAAISYDSTCSTLNPGDSCTILVTYTPTVAASGTSYLVVAQQAGTNGAVKTSIGANTDLIPVSYATTANASPYVLARVLIEGGVDAQSKQGAWVRWTWVAGQPLSTLNDGPYPDMLYKAIPSWAEVSGFGGWTTSNSIREWYAGSETQGPAPAFTAEYPAGTTMTWMMMQLMASFEGLRSGSAAQIRSTGDATQTHCILFTPIPEEAGMSFKWLGNPTDPASCN